MHCDLIRKPFPIDTFLVFHHVPFASPSFLRALVPEDSEGW